MAEKYQDEGLKGNEKIEEAIAALQKEATPEQLAHTLTVIRHRVQEGGQFIVAEDGLYYFSNELAEHIKEQIECKGGKNLGRGGLVDRIYRL